MHYLGIEIVEHPLIPEFRPNFILNPDVPMSDEFRSEMQQWCTEFFGVHRTWLIVSGKVVLVHPNNIVLVRQLIDTQQV